MDPLLTDLEGHFPFHYVEPLLLTKVEVERRATREEVGVLHDEDAAGGFTGGDLEED
jgi:hypothetical protein